MKNPYEHYSKYPKYMSLIEKLQNKGYTWEIGAFHEYYLMPPLRENATDFEKAFRMGAPYFVGDMISFIWAEGIEKEVKEVLDEIFGSEAQ